MKKLSGYRLPAIAATVSTFTILAFSQVAAFASPAGQAQRGANSTGAGGGKGFEGTIEVVTNILIFIVGLAAVIMIIIGAIKYTTSAGDQAAITSAKNTIIYSIVGLILAIMAYAIVRFVLRQFA